MRQSTPNQLDVISSDKMAKLKSAIGRAGRAQAGKSIPEDAIRIRARQKWEAAGKPDGDDLRLWLAAEQELLQSN